MHLILKNVEVVSVERVKSIVKFVIYCFGNFKQFFKIASNERKEQSEVKPFVKYIDIGSIFHYLRCKLEV